MNDKVEKATTYKKAMAIMTIIFVTYFLGVILYDVGLSPLNIGNYLPLSLGVIFYSLGIALLSEKTGEAL